MPTSFPFWLGGVAASLAASCTHPLDVTKVRMQTLENVPGAKRPSTIAVIRMSVSEHGIKSLYTGLTASLLRQMTYSLVRLGAYEEFKSRLAKNGHPSTVQLLMAATVAGGLGGLAGNPADILLVRMTSDVTRPPDKRYGYSNALSGLVRLLREEGVKGLGRGLGTNTTRAILMNSSQVWSYDFFKTTLLRHNVPVINYRFHDGLALHVAASVMAGTFATTVCSPADVIRSRIMSSIGTNTVLMFVFFEQLKKGWAQLMT
ncbi:mitochondrial carrier [Hymenopellis radicata]|nr:mitochondrial carrier [Hymenopellis radicata]